MRSFLRMPSRGPDSVRRAVDDEMRFHLEERTAALIATGLTPEAARIAARREFGDIEEARSYLYRLDQQASVSARRRTFLGELVQDLRYSLRKLRSAPGFTLSALLTLSLGIGVTTALFSIVNAVLLRPLPFPRSSDLYRVWIANPTSGEMQSPVSAVEFDDWRARRNAYQDAGAWLYQEGNSGVDLTGTGTPQRLSTAFVSPGFFSVLGVASGLGRLPREEELVRGGPDKVVVLSHRFWTNQFDRDRAIIGRTLVLNGAPYEVIGVMPPSFRFPSPRVDTYIPYS